MDDTEQDRLTVSAEGFDQFYREVEPRLRRALLSLGNSAAQEATAAAMAYGFENWDRVRRMENPVGYLYRVGRNSVRNRRKPLRHVVPDIAVEHGFEPALPRLLRRHAAPTILHFSDE